MGSILRAHPVRVADDLAALRRDPELWSGCISGAPREDEFLAAFEEQGFFGIEILERGDAPWRTVDGIELRSLTVRASALACDESSPGSWHAAAEPTPGSVAPVQHGVIRIGSALSFATRCA